MGRMSEQFKIYIHSPKHHISEQTIRKFINSVNMIADNLFDGNVYDFKGIDMSEKRFTLFKSFDEKQFTFFNENSEEMSVDEVVDKLNEQQATIQQLQKDCKELIQEKQKLQEKLQVFEHELAVADGLYASDNEEFKNYFRLDFSNLISYPVGEDDE